MHLFRRRRRSSRLDQILAMHKETEQIIREALAEHAEVLFPSGSPDKFDGQTCAPIPCDYEDNFLCFRHRPARHA